MKNTIASAASTPDKEQLVFDLLKQKQEEAFKVIDYYRAAVTTFLFITGGLLKFALDQNATPQLRRGFGTMGIGMGILGLFATVLAEKHRRTIKSEISELTDRLRLNLPKNRLQVQAYAILVVGLLFFVSILGWIYLIWQ
jgi:hypothetical protein